MFATPIAYLINGAGRTLTEVMVGPAAILSIAERVYMRERVEARLLELRTQFERGQSELDSVERRRRYRPQIALALAA